MIVFAAGNYYQASEVSQMVRHDGLVLFYVHGRRWIKSRQKFSGNGLIHCVGEVEPVEVEKVQ